MKTIQTWTWVKVRESLRNNKDPLILATMVMVMILGFLAIRYFTKPNTEPEEVNPEMLAGGSLPPIPPPPPLPPVESVKPQSPSQLTTPEIVLLTAVSNMAKASSELHGLVSSNQMEMFERIENLSTGMTSNNASIRAEIPRSVKEEVARAMEPFQWLLTNPPPPTVVTQFVKCPPAQTVVTQFTTLPPVAVATPTGVTNNNTSNTLVVNIPPPGSQQGATPAVVFNNTVVVGGLPPPPAPGQKLPYWFDRWMQ